MSLSGDKKNSQQDIARFDFQALTLGLKLLLYRLAVVTKIKKNNLFLINLSRKQIL